MGNVMIEVLNREHGKQVIEYFKSQGFDTRDLSGIDIGYYYGVINGIFTEIDDLKKIKEDVKVIELPKEYKKTFPRVMIVSDYPINEDNPGQKRVVFIYKCEKYLAWAGVGTLEEAEKVYCVTNWKYAKDIPDKIIITKSDLLEKETEIKKLFNIDDANQIDFKL